MLNCVEMRHDDADADDDDEDEDDDADCCRCCYYNYCNVIVSIT